MSSTYNIGVVLQFVLATLLPVAAGAILAKLSRTGRLSRFSYRKRQMLIGIIFGIIAIFGTEFGINTPDAVMNVRDAAPLVAGLYFGSPAGILAGLIGGIERWFSVLWGRGMFTRVACSVATCFAGFYAAFLNRYFFDKRKPTWTLALVLGAVAEVLHLLLVFLTNWNAATRAFHVVQACTGPMITCVALSVALSGAAIALVSGQKLFQKKAMRDISQIIQMRMLDVVVLGFVLSVGFTFALQQNTSISDATATIARDCADVKADINDASDDNLLAITRRAAREIPTVADAQNIDLGQLAEDLGVSEIYVVNADGIVAASNIEEYVGFDMGSGAQSRAFLELLPSGRSSYYVQEYRPMAVDETQWRKFAGVRIKDGFVQTSYDASRFADDISAKVEESVKNRHVGTNGLFMVLDESNEITGVRIGQHVTDEDISELQSMVSTHEPGTMFTVNVHDTNYYAMYEEVESFCVIGLLPVSEATQARDLSVLLISFMEVIVYASLFMAIYFLIRHVVVSSIWQVNGTLNRITSGDLKACVEVRNSTEFSSLSDDINRTVGALREAIDAESARIEQDLATAKAIQESALPRTFPPFPEIDAFDIYASMNAAREVGGDFYDFFLIDDHTLGFLLADVSGKGIPAALFMMAAKTELANYIKSGMDLAEAVHSANWNLCRGNDAGMFVTVWAATLDFTDGRLTFVNAGHNPPLLRHNGSWRWLRDRGGLFLGTFDTAKYSASQITLSKGDELVLYTDGVTEAFSAKDEIYGDDRLEAFLSEHTDVHPHVLVDLLRADVRRWARDAEQSDDITILCLEYGVPPEVSGSFEVPATTAGFDELRRRLHFELSQLMCPESAQSRIDLVIEELFTNICKYGYTDPTPTGKEKIMVGYVYSNDPSKIVMSIIDWGVPFDPLGYEGPKDGEGDEVTGLGISLALGYVDDIAYVRDGDRNVVAFTKTW